jgi:phosphoribosylformimino-5-aminoimidazole carboxamide ribotide isomerase
MSLTIVPSIDLRGGRVVRLKQGDYERQVNYDVDPLKTAVAFRHAGAQWLHIVDLDGAKEGRPVQTELITQIIAACGLATQVGGGVRSTDDVKNLLNAGASRVVIGTKAIEDWPGFESRVPSKRAVDIARQISDWPVAAILYTDVAKDGMLQGPNLTHTRELAEAGDVPVIASGGVGNISHIEALTRLPVWGVIVGRSLYEGTVNLAEALRVAASSQSVR